MMYPYMQVTEDTKLYELDGSINSFTFTLSFWSRIKLLFGKKVVVRFDPPITGTMISVGEVA